ncbi:MAG: integrase [Henriciella sp.]|jgi:integrase|nr:site-specific integrase [Henriciella sp.]MAN73056.1 integrase [Henriciella sp.]MBF34813.1 integrase [Hyphomonadaceae bacterium]MBK76239.1 integrase [Henriciella sp.]|tara:strand:+ start:426 stop:1268 length:843 start_codon:yes stop_codon:yes gene_type:complete
MYESRKPLRRSKSYSLNKLKQDIGHIRINQIDRETIVDFGRHRSIEGAGPSTIGMDISYLKTILLHAKAVHGVHTPAEEVQLARVALNRLGLIGKSRERDRRPTQEELDKLFAFFDANTRYLAPMSRIIRFAIATAMRQSEICSFEWDDVDMRRRIVTVRDRKDPRQKDGNHQKVPLVDLTGYDGWALINEQRRHNNNIGRAFPYNPRTVGTAFRRACADLGIDNLHFHDLRHEATSRLFEAGLEIQQVALVTGHKNWKMLKRYTHLTADSIVALAGSNS